MQNVTRILAASAALAGIAAPAAAQNYYPQPYVQPYVQPNVQAYAQPYGYAQQGYGTNPVEQIIGQLLGNRYNVTDQQAVARCASAVLAQAQSQYGAYGYQQGYQRGYGYNQNIAAPAMRVTSITNVDRRTNGLRVRGTIGTGYAANAYNQGYQNRAYGAAGDMTFRCNVDYRGAVTGIRIGGNNQYRRY